MATVSATLAPQYSPASGRRDRVVAWLPWIAVAAALAAALAPVGVSIVTVFLFAGPHNWFEARYFLRRMPLRWGAMRSYFLVGIGGAALLTAGFAALPALATRYELDAAGWDAATGTWNVALTLWILTLVTMRRGLAPRRNWPWVYPVGAAVLAAAWMWPRVWDIGLVYAHPLMALWFLDRELGKRGPAVRSAFRRAAVAVPIAGLLLVAYLADAPPLAGRDVLTERIAWHAGTDVFAVVSDRCPVALHVFLETVHYAVWIVLMPALALRGRPWKLDDVPLVHRSQAWRRAIALTLAAGIAIGLALWIGFAIDYPITRDVYFTIAMLHVLAEIPFLLRLL